MKTYADIAGDGGSNVVAQVQAQRRAIAEALSGVRHRVAVGSGKGGVGKSTVTMALAQALAGRGEKVAILDADFNGPTQARLAGLEGTPWVPGAEGRLALPRRRDGLGVVSMGSLLGEARPLDFDSVAAGDSFTWRATREFAVLAQLLGAVEWGPLDVLLFDLPPGAERTLQYAELLGPEVGFVLVTIPSDLARGVVARSLTALTEAGSRVLGVIENMAGYACPGCGEVRPLFPESAGTLAAPRLGEIPFDPEMAALCDRGWPPGEGAGLASMTAAREAAERIIRTLENPS